MNRTININHSQVMEYLDYDKQSGELSWKKNPTRAACKGKKWGSYPANGGYVVGRFLGVRCRAHQLVFLMHNGYLPEKCIDHINGNKQDNRIENLREFSYTCNRINCTNNSTNTTGVVGVIYVSRYKNWKSAIKINDKRYHLGTADNFEEAVCLRFAAEQCLNWGDCNHRTTARKYVEDVIQRRVMIPLREEFKQQYPEMWGEE